jgi:hypothetical protein
MLVDGFDSWQGFLFVPYHLDVLWGPPSLFHAVKGQGVKLYNSLQSNAEIKNVYMYFQSLIYLHHGKVLKHKKNISYFYYQYIVLL